MKKSVLFTAAAVALVATGAGITAQAETLNLEQQAKQAVQEFNEHGYGYIEGRYPEELLIRLSLFDNDYIRHGR